MSISRIVERFREQEVKETAAIVLSDKNLQRLMAAWPMAPRTVGEVDPQMAWERVWSAVEIDKVVLAELADLNRGNAELTLRRAIGLRLIYPDGSLHSMGKMILQKLIKDALQG